MSSFYFSTTFLLYFQTHFTVSILSHISEEDVKCRRFNLLPRIFYFILPPISRNLALKEGKKMIKGHVKKTQKNHKKKSRTNRGIVLSVETLLHQAIQTSGHSDTL